MCRRRGSKTPSASRWRRSASAKGAELLLRPEPHARARGPARLVGFSRRRGGGLGGLRRRRGLSPGLRLVPRHDLLPFDLPRLVFLLVLLEPLVELLLQLLRLVSQVLQS